MTELIEAVARALATFDGYDPDETWEEFDRNAAATDMMVGGVSDDEIFPKRTMWKEYLGETASVMTAITDAGYRIVKDDGHGLRSDGEACSFSWVGAPCDCGYAAASGDEK